MSEQGGSEPHNISRVSWEELLKKVGAVGSADEDVDSLVTLSSALRYAINSLDELEPLLEDSFYSGGAKENVALRFLLLPEFISLLGKFRLQLRVGLAGLFDGSRVTLDVESLRDAFSRSDIGSSRSSSSLSRATVPGQGVAFVYGSAGQGHPAMLSNAEMCSRRRGELGGVLNVGGIPVAYMQPSKGGPWYLVPDPAFDPV
jgi:hypothetical protein